MDSMTHLPVYSCASSEITSQTVVRVRKCALTWILQNFTFYPQNVGESLDSPQFHASFDKDIKWCLTCYPQGESSLYKDHVSLYLNLISSNSSEDGIKAQFKVSLQNSSGKEIITKTGENTFSESLMWGWNELIKREALTAGVLLPDDKLIIYCEVKTAGRVMTLPNLNGEIRLEETDLSLSQDLGILLEDPKYSDLVLSVSGNEILVHKAILAARSPVFSAMFDNDMRECTQNRVEITDFDMRAIRQMLTFIYTGNINTSQLDVDEAMSLFEVSDKYDITILKTMCENYLCSFASNPSAEIPLLIALAETHHSAKLTEACYEQIKSDPEGTLHSHVWEQVAQKNPLLVLNILRSLAVPNKSSVVVAKNRS